MAGWLCADLMLARFVSGFPAVPMTAGASPTVSAPASVTPAPTRPADRLETQPFTITINATFAELRDGVRTGPAAQSVLAQVTRRMAASGLATRRAGMVLTWATAPTARLNAAVSAAKVVSELLQAGLTPFRDAAMKSLWDGDGPMGGFRLEIYFYAA